MNKTLLRLLTFLTTLLSAIFIFFYWFRISVADINEVHSFMTVPNLLVSGSGMLTQLGGKTMAAIVILLGGVLKYLCVLSAGLGVCGIGKVVVLQKRSRLIFSAQIIALSLNFVALVACLIINIISKQAIIGLLSVTPTLWLFLSVLSSVGALLSSIYFMKVLQRKN